LDAFSFGQRVENWRRPPFSSFTQHNAEGKDTAVTYSTQLCLLLTTLLSAKAPGHDDANPSGAEPLPPLEDHLQPAFQQLLDLVAAFRETAVSPQATLQFEQQLQLHLRELGRQVLQHTYNALEPNDIRVLPKHVRFEGTCYTRLGRKTPQHVWTLFGQVCLRRVGYRSSRNDGEPTLFPLAHSLGLIHGASPALASYAGGLFAGAGMTQSQTRERLRAECGVGWGVKKLRQFLAALDERLRPQRHDSQVKRLVDLLAQAHASKGKYAPVLAVGRDGISLGIRVKKGSEFEMATTATLSVYDRSGKRLGTVYLAYAPQPEQTQMSKELTRLLRGVLTVWQRPLPRLCYVTDAGKSETRYYNRVLAAMRHPVTRQRLKWVRVVDYYHASQRVWTMAECLFGKGRSGSCWAVKMLKWLLLPGGVNRVLHSAVAHRWRLGLRGKKKREFQKAYNYLRRRMKYLRYAQYRSQGMPVGSGVTEAGCKTVYTQRLKLSGMRWGAAPSKNDAMGAQTVLDLRVLLLSEVWDEAFVMMLKTAEVVKILTNEPSSPNSLATVA
jgi:hypothetical protein